MFMDELKNELKEKNKLPKLWVRNVHDVFAEAKVGIIVDGLNKAHQNIIFTTEI